MQDRTLAEQDPAPGLIGPGEPPPVGVERPLAASPLLLIADHAGNRVPAALRQLGLPQAELDRHIGIDIGILGVGLGLSARLGATLIHQRYSRLVIDCNRQPGRADAMPEVSDGTSVPGNLNLTAADRARRVAAIFAPYHVAIAAEIEARLATGRPPVLVALHSFTPKHGDYPAPRPWQVGVLWNRDARMAAPLIRALQDDPGFPGGLTVGLNEPYGVSDAIDYAVPVHAERRGLACVELEIRQDQIGDAAGQADWAARLARVLPLALAEAGLASGDGRLGEGVA